MRPVSILLVENGPEDAALITGQLQSFPKAVEIERVSSRSALEAALERATWDAVISAFPLAAFSGLEALGLVRSLDPEVPFLLISDSTGEEMAVEAMRRGAHDYIRKSNLARLAPALLRELDAAQLRHDYAAGEAELKEKEDRYRALIEHASDLVTILDVQGVFTYVSPSLERLLGYRRNDFIGVNGFDFIHPDDRARIWNVFETQVITSSASQRVEYRVRHQDGTWRWFESIGHNLFHHPAVHGAVVTSRDITERKMLEGQLAQAERLSSIGRLAATVAHEFNNVLMGIQPFVDVIRRHGADREKIVSSAAMIATSVERGRLITQDIIRFTQPVAPAIQTVEARGWLKRLGAGLAEQLGSRFTLELPDERGTESMCADPNLLAQVVTNIVFNARDAMPAGGVIAVQVSVVHGAQVFPYGVLPDAREYVRISIQDAGTGIPRDMVGRIFDPLFTTKKSGTGLGLAVAHQIVTRHDGFLFVESVPGSGTTFHVCIPASESKALPQETTPATASTERRVSFNLLLVEDDVAVAEGIAAVLRLADHQVTIARTGRTAKMAVEEHGFDAIVLDVTLPDMSGVDVFRYIRQLKPGMPVVFSTGHYSPSGLEELLGNSDDVAFLMKPYDVDALLAGLRRVVPGSKQ